MPRPGTAASSVSLTRGTAIVRGLVPPVRPRRRLSMPKVLSVDTVTLARGHNLSITSLRHVSRRPASSRDITWKRPRAANGQFRAGGDIMHAYYARRGVATCRSRDEGWELPGSDRLQTACEWNSGRARESAADENRTEKFRRGIAPLVQPSIFRDKKPLWLYAAVNRPPKKIQNLLSRL